MLEDFRANVLKARNLMQMTECYCFWSFHSFAFGSTHVKFDFWPVPKSVGAY